LPYAISTQGNFLLNAEGGLGLRMYHAHLGHFDDRARHTDSNETSVARAAPADTDHITDFRLDLHTACSRLQAAVRQCDRWGARGGEGALSRGLGKQFS